MHENTCKKFCQTLSFLSLQGIFRSYKLQFTIEMHSASLHAKMKAPNLVNSHIFINI